MFPGMGKIDPKKMQQMMKQFGIHQEEIDAYRVVIEKNNGRKIIIENPDVQKVKMSGQESWQITGDAREEDFEEDISLEDIKLIKDKTGKGEEEIRRILESVNGDIAEAILKLT